VEDDQASFQVSDRPSFNSVYRVTYAGSARILGSSAGVNVAVRGRVGLKAAPTKTGFKLTAALTPRVAGSTITFQVWSAGKWRSIKVVKAGPTGQAAATWSAPKGTYPLRAVLASSTTLTGNYSTPLRLRR